MAQPEQLTSSIINFYKSLTRKACFEGGPIKAMFCLCNKITDMYGAGIAATVLPKHKIGAIRGIFFVFLSY